MAQRKHMTRSDLLTNLTQQPQTVTAALHIFMLEQNDRIADLLTIIYHMCGYETTRYVDRHALHIDLPNRGPIAQQRAVILLDLNEANKPQEGVGAFIETLRTYWQDRKDCPAILVITTSPRIKAQAEADGRRVVMLPFKPRVLCEAIQEEICSVISERSDQQE